MIGGTLVQRLLAAPTSPSGELLLDDFVHQTKQPGADFPGLDRNTLVSNAVVDISGSAGGKEGVSDAGGAAPSASPPSPSPCTPSPFPSSHFPPSPSHTPSHPSTPLPLSVVTLVVPSAAKSFFAVAMSDLYLDAVGSFTSAQVSQWWI